MGIKLLHAAWNEIKILRYLIRNRVYIAPKLEKDIINQFHKLYYDSQLFNKTWGNTFWFGIPTQKCPLDLWIYQEIIFETKPDAIIECGTKYGGSASFFASMCDIANHGEIITIDNVDRTNRPQHKRIKYLLGSSTSEETVERVRKLISNANNVMVILDSDHSKEHVLNELKIYSALTTKENYIIVEDTNINGNPVRPDFGPGPMEAVEQFLKENRDFIIDQSKEKFYLTWNPRGYLKKIR